MPLFLAQKLFIEGLWLGLAILWWLVNLLEDPIDDADDTTMDTDASRCLWALYYGRRPDLISWSTLTRQVTGTVVRKKSRR